VCQTSIEISEARHFGTWQGLTWYFCSAACRSKFLANPLRYSAFAPGMPGAPGVPDKR
jgi:P-type Cu+ transporter